MHLDINKLLQQAQAAKKSIAFATTDQKNALLAAMADDLVKHTAEILNANSIDIENAKNVISPVMIDRLRLDTSRVCAMADGVRALIALQDPIGVCEKTIERPNGLLIKKIRVPMGVIAMIYESRPNVTSDAAALCIKSGSVAVLRGGKEAINTNTVIAKIMRNTAHLMDFDPNIILFVTDTSHESASALMQARGKVDLLIPRGGERLIKACVDGAKVPCIETGTGICHVYVDENANLDMAIKILENAKMSRPSVCNACEVCLVHSAVADEFLKKLEKLSADKGLSLRLDDKASKIISGTKATAKDFDTEFSDYILAVSVVDSADQAIEHISIHSTSHSDCIVTDCQETADRFLQRVDSAAVYHNASTRFTDGGEFGLGCEIGIATQKVGARGPMGLFEITTYKYVVSGNGQIR